MEQKLLDAYRYWRFPPSANGTRKSQHPACVALEHARSDVAAGKARYPAADIHPAVTWQRPHGVKLAWAGPRVAYVENPANAGLRLVGHVMPDPGRRNGVWNDEPTRYGWNTDPYGDSDNLASGVVYQLTGRNGKARFVAGWEFGDDNGGPMVDFGTITEHLVCDFAYRGSARDAAYETDIWRDADHMAQRAAESEMDYQRAWQAGSRWRDCVDAIASIRRELKSLFAERKAARPIAQFPAMCAAIKRDISRQWDEMNAAREERDTWAAGSGSVGDCYLGFERRNPDHVAAFCDAAGLKEMPRR